jgi:hypothetical protein
MQETLIEQKVFHLTLNKKWFDMIASGEKTEEYREIKPYWMRRLMIDVEVRTPTSTYEDVIRWIKDGNNYDVSYGLQEYDIISANNGYQKNCPNIKWKHKGIRIGEGREDWGAEPGKQYFILEIGELIK